MFKHTHTVKREQMVLSLKSPIPKRRKTLQVHERAPLPPAPSSQNPLVGTSSNSPTKSISSTWSASSYGDSPPKSRLEMKKMKRNWLRDSGLTTPTAPMSHENLSSDASCGNGSTNASQCTSVTTLKSEPGSIATAPMSKIIPLVKNGKIKKVDVKSKLNEKESLASKRSETRITIRRKVENKKTTEESTDTSPDRKSPKKSVVQTDPDPHPAWLSPFLVGGNIAEKVKLSRRKASMKNTVKIQEQVTRPTRKPKAKPKLSTKLSKPKTVSTKKESSVKEIKKHPLRISLKLNSSKNLKTTQSNLTSTKVIQKKSSSTAACHISRKKKPPAVVKIRRKKKRRAVPESSSSSSSSGSETSSSESDSSDSESDSSNSDSGSESSSGSSSDSSGSSSSGSNSSSSDDDSNSSDSESELNPKHKMKSTSIARNMHRKTLKVMGKPASKSIYKIREMKKDKIDCDKLPCDKLPCEHVPKVRTLTQSEIRSILAADGDSAGMSSNLWVRRSTRQPSRSAVSAPNIRAIVGKLEMNDPDMVVLKCKKYLSDSDTPTVITDAMLDALEKNTNCQALYIQNFNTGMRDEQVLHLLRILQLPSCKIWCLNIGETYNVKRRTWAQFTNGLKKTNITHMYASEHTISSAMKEKIRETIRNNRKKHTMHIDPNNLDVIVQCTHCWWNPINAKVLKPYIKQGGLEYLLFDKVAQGAKDVVTDASKI